MAASLCPPRAPAGCFKKERGLAGGWARGRPREARRASEWGRAGASPNPRDNDVHEAREAIGDCQSFVIADVVVRERVAIKRAAPKGLTVAEYRPADPKAAEELDALYRLAFAEG